MTIYTDYTRDRMGWFFGVRSWQLAAVSVSTLPVFWAGGCVLLRADHSAAS